MIVFQNGSPWRPFSGEVDFLPDYTTTSSDVALMMYSDGSVDGSGFGVFIDLCNLEGRRQCAFDVAPLVEKWGGADRLTGSCAAAFLAAPHRQETARKDRVASTRR